MLLTSRFAVLPLSYNVLNLSFVCDIFSHKVSGHEVLCKSSLASVSASASCYYYYQILLIIITLPHFVRLRPPSCHAVRASVVHVQTVRRQSQRGVHRSTPKKAAPCLYHVSGSYG